MNWRCENWYDIEDISYIMKWITEKVEAYP